MRFSFNLKFISDENIRIPLSYRRGILSLFKEAIHNFNNELYTYYWGEPTLNKLKPFTFSVHIPDATKENSNNYLTTTAGYLRIFVSSVEKSFIINLYNGLLNLPNKYNFYNYSIGIDNFQIINSYPIISNQALFKTISPMVIRKIESKKGAGYLTPEHENYVDSLAYSICNLTNNFMSEHTYLNREIEIEIKNSDIVIIPHYNEYLSAVNAQLKISAVPEILQLIYDCGLGARRSQGFGMVEVVR